MGKSSILSGTFWQLFTIYTLAVAVIMIGGFNKYAFHFELLAIVIAIIGAARKQKARTPTSLTNALFILGIAAIIITRIAPFVHTDIPMGFDAGLYTAAIDQYAKENVDKWFLDWSPPGLFIVTDVFKGLGVETKQITIWFFVLLQLVLGLSIYLFTKTMFGRDAGIISLFLFAFSYAEYVMFQALFFKNVLALILLLGTFTLFVWQEYAIGTIVAASLFGVHQPTFLVFGMSYLIYTIHTFKDKPLLKKHVAAGVSILVLGALFYAHNIMELLINKVGALQPSAGAGAFMSFPTYQFSSLPYLIPAALGFFIATRRKEFSFLWYWFAFSAIVVACKLFFYHRFIIFLDVAGIIFASFALAELLSQKRKTTALIITLSILAMASAILPLIQSSPYHISEKEQTFISELGTLTEANASIVSNMVEDAPLLVAYSGRPIIAPGLFGHSGWTQSEWQRYWTAGNISDVKDLLDRYPRPLYIYMGEKSKRGNLDKFNASCITSIKKEQRIEVLRYDC